MSSSNAPMTGFRAFLEENGWRYLTEEDGSVRGLVSGPNGQCHWYAYLNADGRFLVFKSFCPINTSARRRAAVAEYLMRANWGLNFGNFEMDWSDGQVCFRTVVLTENLHAASETLGHLIYGNHSTIDRYLAGLLSVACGHTVPSKAIEEAEQDLRPSSEPTEQLTIGDPAELSQPARRRRRFSPDQN